MLGRNELLSQNLDIVDEVVRLLDGARSSALKDVSESCPRFVVLGPQSAGKSSILSRLSGMTMKLPTSKERCTRMVTLILLRREATVNKPQVFIRGRLGEQAINEEIVVNGEDNDAFEEAMRNAQTRAIEIEGVSDQDSFVQNLVIEVHLKHPEVPNVTLVDLPGLIADTGDNTSILKAVEDMAETQVSQSGTLILYIVPLNQDFDTVLGRPILKRHTERNGKSITVLTKADCVPSDGSLATLLEKTVGQTGSVSHHMVIGEHKEKLVTEQEEKGLLSRFTAELEHTNVLLGINQLREQVEVRIGEHLRAQLPITVGVIEKQLKDLREELDGPYGVGRIAKSGLQVLSGVKRTLDSLLAGNEPQRQRFFRNKGEELSRALKSIPFVQGAAGTNETLTILSEMIEYEIGTECQVLIKTDDSDAGTWRSGYVLESFPREIDGGKSKILAVKVQRLATKQVSEQKVFNVAICLPSEKKALQMIQAVCDEVRGVGNTAHLGCQKVLDCFAPRWAKSCGERITTCVKDISRHVHVELRGVLHSKIIPESCKTLLADCESVVDRIMKEMDEMANATVKRLVEYNTPPLVFTTNEHYLESNFRALLGNDGVLNGATDEGSLRTIYFHCLAYWKVQLKVLIENVMKDLCAIFLITAYRQFQELVLDPLVHSHEKVRETPDVAAKREMLIKSELILVKASSLLSEIKW